MVVEILGCGFFVFPPTTVRLIQHVLKLGKVFNLKFIDFKTNMTRIFVIDLLYKCKETHCLRP